MIVVKLVTARADTVMDRTTFVQMAVLTQVALITLIVLLVCVDRTIVVVV
jgi:hypothetical protein